MEDSRYNFKLLDENDNLCVFLYDKIPLNEKYIKCNICNNKFTYDNTKIYLENNKNCPVCSDKTFSEFKVYINSDDENISICDSESEWETLIDYNEFPHNHNNYKNPLQPNEKNENLRHYHLIKHYHHDHTFSELCFNRQINYKNYEEYSNIKDENGHFIKNTLFFNNYWFDMKHYENYKYAEEPNTINHYHHIHHYYFLGNQPIYYFEDEYKILNEEEIGGYKCSFDNIQSVEHHHHIKHQIFEMSISIDDEDQSYQSYDSDIISDSEDSEVTINLNLA